MELAPASGLVSGSAAGVVDERYLAKLIPLCAGFKGPVGGALWSDIYMIHLAEVLTRLGQSALASGGRVAITASLETFFAIFHCRRLWRPIQ